MEMMLQLELFIHASLSVCLTSVMFFLLHFIIIALVTFCCSLVSGHELRSRFAGMLILPCLVKLNSYLYKSLDWKLVPWNDRKLSY